MWRSMAPRVIHYQTGRGKNLSAHRRACVSYAVAGREWKGCGGYVCLQWWFNGNFTKGVPCGIVAGSKKLWDVCMCTRNTCFTRVPKVRLVRTIHTKAKTNGKRDGLEVRPLLHPPRREIHTRASGFYYIIIIIWPSSVYIYIYLQYITVQTKVKTRSSYINHPFLRTIKTAPGQNAARYYIVTFCLYYLCGSA